MTAKLRLIPSLLVVALSGVAFAAVAGNSGTGQELTQEQQKLMEQLDSNKDGVISESEAATHPKLAQRFEEIDRNGDQRLEKAEFARFEVRDSEGMDR